MSAKSDALLAKISQRNEEVKAIEAYWKSLFPDLEALSTQQCINWLLRYDFDIIAEGLDAAFTAQQKRLSANTPAALQNAVQYASGCMKQIKLRGEE